MKKIIAGLLLVIGFVGNIFASNAIESSTKKPKRSEVLYQGIVPYFFYDYSDYRVKKTVVQIDLSQMTEFHELIDYLKKTGLYFQPLKDFHSICLSGKCFSNTEEFKSASDFIRQGVSEHDAQMYVPLSLNSEDYFFPDSLLYQSWSEEDHLKLFKSVSEEIQELSQDYSFGDFLDDDEDDFQSDDVDSFALSSSYDESEEYQSDSEDNNDDYQ